MSMTLEIYAHVLPDMQEDAAATLAAMLHRQNTTTEPTWQMDSQAAQLPLPSSAPAKARSHSSGSAGSCTTSLSHLSIAICASGLHSRIAAPFVGDSLSTADARASN
jgi:hypothetical protein